MTPLLRNYIPISASINKYKNTQLEYFKFINKNYAISVLYDFESIIEYSFLT
jgi:hypothetical protein